LAVFKASVPKISSKSFLPNRSNPGLLDIHVPLFPSTQTHFLDDNECLKVVFRDPATHLDESWAHYFQLELPKVFKF